MSARLIPGLAARFAQPVPLRTVVRQFSSTVRVATSSSASSSTQRLGSQQFFTSSQPKIQFLAGALGKLGARSALAASSGIVRTAGRPAWSPSSFTAAFFRRAFSSSRQGLARPSYSPRGGGGWQPPPPPSFWAKLRARINGIEPPHLVYGIIGLNLAIFGLWAYAINSYQRFRDPSMYNWMYKNFINSWYNIKEGRVWTLITSCFSHMDLAHVFMNCLGLYFIGPTVASVIGTAGFLGLYLGGGLVSGLASLWAQASLPQKRGVAGSDGASGAIYATLAFFGGLFPTQKFLFFFVIPMPAWFLIGGIFAWDLYGTFNRRGSMTDSAGHVGGIVAGLAAALAVRRGVWRPRPW